MRSLQEKWKHEQGTEFGDSGRETVWQFVHVWMVGSLRKMVWLSMFKYLGLDKRVNSSFRIFEAVFWPLKNVRQNKFTPRQVAHHISGHRKSENDLTVIDLLNVKVVSKEHLLGLWLRTTVWRCRLMLMCWGAQMVLCKFTSGSKTDFYMHKDIAESVHL